MNTIKIALKCCLKNNKQNQILLLMIGIIVSIITLLYSSIDSVSNQVVEQKKIVFGIFTDIYYFNDRKTITEVTNEELKEVLSGFHYNRYGAIYTVYRENLNGVKYLNMGYLDGTAIELSCINMIDGNFPKHDNEIAMSEGMISFYEKSLGDSINIGKHQYIIVGIFSDYGHLWPRGEKEINENISPTNAIITKEQALTIYDDNERVLTQILIERTNGISNSTESVEGFYQNINVDNSEGNIFEIPQLFRILIYFITIFIILSFFMMNQERMLRRINTYISLGMEMRQAISSIKYELYFISILGFINGVIFGILLSSLLLVILSVFMNLGFALQFNFEDHYLTYILIFLSVLIMIHLNSNWLQSKIINQASVNRRLYSFTKKRINLLRFDSFIGKKFLIISILVIALTITLLTYSVYYAFYLQEDVLALATGYIPRDYDFQFTSVIQNASPIDNIDGGEEDKVVLFTDLYEKNGASQQFVDQLEMEKGVHSIIPYRENTKMNVRINKNELDEYLKGYDDIFQLQGLTGITNYNLIYDTFDYNENDILVNSTVTGYTEQSIVTLADCIAEGEINIDKLSSGEEIILRVPAYKKVTKMFGDIEANGILVVDPESKDAINSTLLDVGDVIELTGILTDEAINGGVQEKDLDSFYRLDVKVKIGAIIRTADGMLPSLGNSGANAYQILTTNEGFKNLGIPGEYSVVSIYTNTDVDQNSMRNLMYEYSINVPNMILEDWQLEVFTYKIYNALVKLFCCMLITLLIIVSFIFILNQFIMKMRMNMPIYYLYKINGLDRYQLNRIWMMQIGICYIIGSIIAVLLIGLTFLYLLNIEKNDLLKYMSNWHIGIGYIITGLIVVIAFLICKNIYVKLEETMTVNSL